MKNLFIKYGFAFVPAILLAQNAQIVKRVITPTVDLQLEVIQIDFAEVEIDPCREYPFGDCGFIEPYSR